MATIKLTDARIDALKAPDPTGRQNLHWDSQTRGLGVLCSGTTTAKSFIVQHKLADRRTRRVTIGPVAMGLKKARADAATIIASMLHGADPKADRRAAARRARTLREALDAYLTDNRQLGERTREGYRGAVTTHLAAWLDSPVREIGVEAVISRHAAIAADVARRRKGTNFGGGPATGHATADGVMRALRAIYYHAAALDPTLPPNPVKLKKSWFRVKARTRTVDRDQLPAFYRAVTGLDNGALRDYVMLVLFTGLRRGEAGALRWDEVSFRDRLIRLPAARTKTKRQLDLPMTNVVHDLLVARRAIGREGPFVFTAGSKSGHVEEPKGGFERIAVATAIEGARAAGVALPARGDPPADIVAKYGISVGPHDLRRLYVTVANGVVPGRDAMALVNHSVGGDVHSGYDQVTTDELRGSAQRVADRLKELCEIPALPVGMPRVGDRA